MSATRSTLMAAAAAVCWFGWAIPSQAQIVYPFPRYGNTRPDSSVRLEVTPSDAEVYIDGYYAGVVDDFDGWLQRLRVEPGQHEITIYRDGFRAFRQSVYLTRDRTFKIKRQLDKLPAGEAGEPRPTPALRPAGTQPPVPLPRGRRGDPSGPPPKTPPAGTTAGADRAANGRLTIRVQPSGADVLIDGQAWSASPGEDTVVIDVSEGRHVIQARKSGYIGYLTEVEVRRGESRTVAVTLRRQP
jgi:hypothetical protein